MYKIVPDCSLKYQLFIPACAGSTKSLGWPWLRPWDHPRIRGVHYPVRRSSASASGSSPHARGLRACSVIYFLCRRFIPACAGSTKKIFLGFSLFWVHPRMRGVHATDGIFNGLVVGSSPHTRGPLLVQRFPRGLFRFIPACAGSTASLSSLFFATAVHPRMRGVHAVMTVTVIMLLGSSPHARGPLHHDGPVLYS